MSCFKNDNTDQEIMYSIGCNLCPAFNFIVTLIVALYRRFCIIVTISRIKQKTPIGQSLTDGRCRCMCSYFLPASITKINGISKMVNRILKHKRV